jgi:ketosteroid isomerase-like protein
MLRLPASRWHACRRDRDCDVRCSRRIALSGWSAWSRGDLDLMLVRYAPNCRFEVPPELVAAGMRSAYQGHAGARESTADFIDAFERAETTPIEVVDGGDRLVSLGHMHARARRSGVELDSPVGVAYSFERGLVVHERQFFDWDEALRAAGIPTTGAGSEAPPAAVRTPHSG